MKKQEQPKRKINFMFLIIIFLNAIIYFATVMIDTLSLSPFSLGLERGTLSYKYVADIYNGDYSRIYALLGLLNVSLFTFWGVIIIFKRMINGLGRVKKSDKIKLIASQLKSLYLLNVKYLSENSFKLYGTMRNEEFAKKYSNGTIFRIKDNIRKELKNFEQEDKTIKLKLVDIAVNEKEIELFIEFKQIEEKEQLNNQFAEIINRIEHEYKLDYVEQKDENVFVMLGDTKDIESDFYKNFGGDKIFKFEDNLQKDLKELGNKNRVKIKILDIKKINGFEVELEFTKKADIKEATPDMKNLSHILQIQDRFKDEPDLLEISRDKNNQLHLFYEKLATIETQTWQSKMKIVKNIFNLNPQISFNKDNVEIALYEDLPKIYTFHEDEFKKHLKVGHLHLGINQKQEQVYLKLDGLKHFIFGATTGGGKGVLMQLMTHSAVYQVNTKTISSIDIIDPKATEMAQYKGLDKNINVFLGYEEIPKAILNMEVEFEARRKYLNDNKLRKFFENYKVIFFDEFDQINKLADEQGREVSEYCFMILKRVLQLGRSFGVKVLLTSQDLTAETIPTVFRALFEDRAIGKTLEKYHATCLVDETVFESFGYENTKSLTTGQYILQTGGEASNENTFFQCYFSETDPNKKGGVVNKFREVYEKGKEELEQDESFEKELYKVKVEVLKAMRNDENNEDFKNDLIDELLEEWGEEVEIKDDFIEVKIENEIDEEDEDFINNKLLEIRNKRMKLTDLGD